MVANLLIFLNNDFFKSFILLLLFVIFFVVIKNFADKKKLEKKILFSNSINDFQVDGFQHFNAQAKTEIYAENLNPKFELIAKLESVSQNRFPKPAIVRLENVIRIGKMSIRLSDRVLGSLGNLKTFYVGILLVNRHGSLTLIEHIEFLETLKSIAIEFDLRLKIKDYSDVVKKLKPLKSQINDLDCKLILTVRLSEFPSKFAINGLSEKLHLVKYAENRFAKVDKFGVPEFTIVSADHVNDLNIIMDLPRVDDPEKVFKSMYEIVDWLVIQFEGCIIDKNGNQLSVDSKSIIFNQISSKSHLLKKFGLTPGGSLSMKVFN